MTQLRWDDPPKEQDPTNYDPARDPALRFIGKQDAPTDGKIAQLKLKDRLCELEDRIAFLKDAIRMQTVEENLSDPWCLKGQIDDALSEFAALTLKLSEFTVSERLETR